MLGNYDKMHRVHKCSLVIENIMMCYIIKYANIVQINNKNKILLPYIIDTFYLHYKLIQKLLDNCDKIQDAYQ